jgi:hypothetical protein
MKRLFFKHLCSRNAFSIQSIERVGAAIKENPRSSVRRIAQETGNSRTTAHRIMRQAIGVFPYKIGKTFKQQEADKLKRVNFCLWLQQKVDENPHFLTTCGGRMRVTSGSTATLTHKTCVIGANRIRP